MSVPDTCTAGMLANEQVLFFHWVHFIRKEKEHTFRLELLRCKVPTNNDGLLVGEVLHFSMVSGFSLTGVQLL